MTVKFVELCERAQTNQWRYRNKTKGAGVNAGHWETGPCWQSWSYFSIVMVTPGVTLAEGSVRPSRVSHQEDRRRRKCSLLRRHILNNDILTQFSDLLFPLGNCCGLVFYRKFMLWYEWEKRKKMWMFFNYFYSV